MWLHIVLYSEGLTHMGMLDPRFMMRMALLGPVRVYVSLLYSNISLMYTVTPGFVSFLPSLLLAQFCCNLSTNMITQPALGLFYLCVRHSLYCLNWKGAQLAVLQLEDQLSMVCCSILCNLGFGSLCCLVLCNVGSGSLCD